MIQFRLIYQIGLALILSIGSLLTHLPTHKPLLSGNAPPVKSEKPDSIRIGLLIPSWEATSAKNASELAIHIANEKGGYSGKPFDLVVRSVEGPWGAGSKESVSLVFDDNVVAILGSLDGRNAHLAEQVATKAHIVYLSAWASDPTLSQAFVPWYFRCVPSDRQQAKALVEEIYIRKKLKRIGIISTDDYDSKSGASAFMKITESEKKPRPDQFLYSYSEETIKDFLKQLESKNLEGLVFFGQATSSLEIIKQLRKSAMKQAVYGSLSLLNSEKSASELEGVVIISPNFWSTSKGEKFIKDYYERFGDSPDLAAAYAYDGINLLIESIREVGFDREKIQESLSRINFNGVTGNIYFDKMGNRISPVELVEIKNGKTISIND